MTTKTLKYARNAVLGLASLILLNSAAKAEEKKADPLIEISGFSTNGQTSGSGFEAAAFYENPFKGKHDERLSVIVKDDFACYRESYEFNNASIADYKGCKNKLGASLGYEFNDKMPISLGLEIETNSLEANINGLNSPVTHKELAVGPIISLGYIIPETSKFLTSITPYINMAFKSASNKDSIGGNEVNNSNTGQLEFNLGVNADISDYKTKDSNQPNFCGDSFSIKIEYGQKIKGIEENTSTLNLGLKKRISKILKLAFGIKNVNTTTAGKSAEQTQLNFGAEYGF
jgi:hypothetical protein